MTSKASKVQFWRCEDCDGISETADLLHAPSPFGRRDEEVLGCPKCRSIEGLRANCDYPGCTRDVSSGTPMADGDYLNRCWEHSPTAIGRAVAKVAQMALAA